jgi:hypothetical protein
VFHLFSWLFFKAQSHTPLQLAVLPSAVVPCVQNLIGAIHGVQNPWTFGALSFDQETAAEDIFPARPFTNGSFLFF